MLAHETDFDDHLDALEDRSGHVFSLSRKQVKVDGVKNHMIHVFYIPLGMFEALDAELRSTEAWFHNSA